MDKELVDALSVVEKKLRELQGYFDSLSSQVEVLETRKGTLSKNIEDAEKCLQDIEAERENLQLLIEDKKKEQHITIIGIKHAREDVERRTEILNTREENLDRREARIKDREAMHNISPEK